MSQIRRAISARLSYRPLTYMWGLQAIQPYTADWVEGTLFGHYGGAYGDYGLFNIFDSNERLTAGIIASAAKHATQAQLGSRLSEAKSASGYDKVLSLEPADRSQAAAQGAWWMAVAARMTGAKTLGIAAAAKAAKAQAMLGTYASSEGLDEEFEDAAETIKEKVPSWSTNFQIRAIITKLDMSSRSASSAAAELEPESEEDPGLGDRVLTLGETVVKFWWVPLIAAPTLWFGSRFLFKKYGG